MLFFAICKKQIRNLLHLWIDGCNEDAENDCNIDNYDVDDDKEEEEEEEGEDEWEKDVSLYCVLSNIRSKYHYVFWRFADYLVGFHPKSRN